MSNSEIGWNIQRTCFSDILPAFYPAGGGISEKRAPETFRPCQHWTHSFLLSDLLSISTAQHHSSWPLYTCAAWKMEIFALARQMHTSDKTNKQLFRDCPLISNNLFGSAFKSFSLYLISWLLSHVTCLWFLENFRRRWMFSLVKALLRRKDKSYCAMWPSLHSMRSYENK